MLNLLTPIEKVKGIGPSFLSRMKKIGIKNIKDLIFYFPSRYEDFSRIISISEIKINEICTVKGKIAEIKNERTWKKRMLITQAFIKDETGMIKAVWFNQPYLTKILKKGDEIFISGRVAVGKKEVYFSNPVFEKKYKDKEKDLKHTGRIVPVYSEKTGVSSRWLRFILKPLLERIKKAIPETLPEKIIKENNLFPLNQALWQIHFPDSLKMAQKAKERFSFEELFLIHLFVLRERLYLSQERAVSFKMKVDLIKRFVDSLPFKLTDAQKKASYIILKDLEKNKPMNRLLEGDVGSGKTVVAAIAALNVIKHRYQVAFMAPTEILANQHFNTIFHLLKDFNVVIGILTGKKDRLYTSKLKNDFIEISRRKILEKTLKGEIDMLIGTHALIQDKVKFKNLGLVILDEQHRFGVEQRARLCQKEKNKVQFIPHLLSMTATPIPRTLALTIYGDLDLSLLDEMPQGRKKIITKIIDPQEREEVYCFIRKEVKRGRQAFIICPKIGKDDSERDVFDINSDRAGNVFDSDIKGDKINSWSEVKAVKEEYKKLKEEIFPDLKVGMIHGKMKPKEKEKIMRDMKNKKIDVLVSTSVIEVGIDIPNATVMVIEGAERFGLAQLHQFRGRVGRAGYQSYCFLFTTFPDQLNRKRLRALVNSNSGFELAEKDLEIRGPGSFAGTRQWGIPDLMMNALTDLKLVEKSREAAKKILLEDPKLERYFYLKKELKKFREKIHLE